MKTKKLISLIIVLALCMGIMTIPAVASGTANEAAENLHELGLFQGVGTNADGTPNFDLDRAPTRHEAVTMLVRLLGKEAEARAGDWDMPFTDVDEWAKPSVTLRTYAHALKEHDRELFLYPT